MHSTGAITNKKKQEEERKKKAAAAAAAAAAKEEAKKLKEKEAAAKKKKEQEEEKKKAAAAAAANGGARATASGSVVKVNGVRGLCLGCSQDPDDYGRAAAGDARACGSRGQMNALAGIKKDVEVSPIHYASTPF